MEIQVLAGILASALGILGFVPYIIAILGKKTIPHRISWLVWSVLGVITAASYYSAGARESALLPFANALAHVCVFALSLKYGTGGWGKSDKICLAGAGVCLGVWYLTSNPAVALGLTILVEFLGAVPTLLKTYKSPQSEDKLGWGLFFSANAVNILAIGIWTPVVAAYPIYSISISAVMNVLIWRKKEK